ncbi:MAG: hypothetical protein E6I76_14505 [Chloroflexi bacterium]|nr:MAG: hypothetical protein E6I76_14505 [Chloroflexota bacterium]
MTTRRGLVVWVGRVLRGMSALALALAVFVIAAPSGAAMGRPPLLDDQPPVTATAPPRPDAGVTPCADPAGAARDPERGHGAPPCPSPAAASPVSVRQPASALTGTRPARPAGPAVPPSTGSPAATPAPAPLRALPIPPPIWLVPTLAPVPQSYAAELAPTSVLVLGFGSVALASTVMALRLLRGGR